MTHPMHPSKSERWRTPEEIVSLARSTMGWIDLDPASEPEANETVQATQFFTEAQDGLAQSWSGAVFLNPPGGKFPKGHEMGGQSRPLAWWRKLMGELKADRIDQAVFVAFSIEMLATSQGLGVPCATDFPTCILKKRIHFVWPDGEQMDERQMALFEGEAGVIPELRLSRPTHSNAVIYTPGKVNNTARFVAAFSPFGRISWPNPMASAFG
jgi:hypothetical protein